MPIRPFAFLSYAHRDDDYHNLLITKLGTELGKAVSVAIGANFSIFQDRKDLAWGENWPSALDRSLEGSCFLIAILSPSFFNSPYCRQELKEFIEIERRAGRNDLVLPIYLVDTPLLENAEKRADDPLAQLMSERQRRDWRDLRYEPFEDPKIRRAVDALAKDMVRALERSNPSYGTPFAEQSDSYEIGAFEDPLAFVTEARKQGLMEGQTATLNLNANSALPEPGTVFRDIDEPWCPQMVVIPPGSFVMGSPADEEGRQDNEEPEHRVHIEKPFALGIYPVTFDQYDHFCVETGRRKPGDESWGRRSRPIINVNVEDAEAYLVWLSKETGETYSLPSEAMWEYACRGGTTTSFSTGGEISKDQAHFIFSYGEATTEVGSFDANPFGLFDMHGNVWELCADHWHENFDGAPTNGSPWIRAGDDAKQVLRGGSWFNISKHLRSASRAGVLHDVRNGVIGFRCARS